jgi:hypothetical protein
MIAPITTDKIIQSNHKLLKTIKQSAFVHHLFLFFIILLLSSTHNAPTDNGQQLLLQTMGRVSLGFLLFQAMHHSSCPSLGDITVTGKRRYRHLDSTGSVEVLEGLGDTGSHGLLTLADPDTGLYTAY